MKRIPIYVAIAVLFLSLPLAAMGNAEQPQRSSLPIVVVSILPQQYFIDRIAGDAVESVVLVGPGQSPHSYEPTPRQMTLLSQATAWIVSRTDFENQLIPRVQALYPDLMIVDGTEGVTFRFLDENHVHDVNDPHDTHDDIEYDKHTWLGKTPAKLLAKHVKDTLRSIVPEKSDMFNDNYQELIEEIDDVFNALDSKLAPLAETTVFVYHPSFGYFLDDFHIHQQAVETGGKEPTPKALAQLIEMAQEVHPSAIFVQAQFPSFAAEKVAQAVGAKVIALDPLAYDWLDNIRLIGDTLSEYLEDVR